VGVRRRAGRRQRRQALPAVGELTLRYETLRLPESAGQAGQELHVFNAEEGAEEALRLLGARSAPPR
jgi:hypothetical protein